MQDWIDKWMVDALECGIDSAEASATMASPKYVVREWMLENAYKAAERNDYEPMRTLHQLFKTPYDEHPEHEQEYYKLGLEPSSIT